MSTSLSTGCRLVWGIENKTGYMDIAKNHVWTYP